MPELYTASQMHDVYCKASGLEAQQHPSLLNRFRYMAKRGLLADGGNIDERGTYAFPKIEVYRAAIYTELAGIAMDMRAFASITEAAARRHPNGLRVSPSMKRRGGYYSRGGLLDAIHGVAQGENWSLIIEAKLPGLNAQGGMTADFIWDDGESSPDTSEEVDTILGRKRSRTRVTVDLYSLFRPLIEIVGLPD